MSRAARDAEAQAPGDASDAVVWEQVIRSTDADSALSVSYVAFMTIATLLAAIAIINDSAILTVGAMVLGPEFVTLAALAVAVVWRRPAGARQRRGHAGAGLPRSRIAVTAAATLVGRLLGWFGPELLERRRPQTAFITSPDRWSLVVAVARRHRRRPVADVGEERCAGRRVHLRHHRAGGRAPWRSRWRSGGGHDVSRAAIQLGVNLGGILVAADRDAGRPAGGLAAGARRRPRRTRRAGAAADRDWPGRRLTTRAPAGGGP